MDKFKWFLVLMCLVGINEKDFAQGSKLDDRNVFGQTKLVLVGNAEAVYNFDKNENGFGNVAFKPIFLWSLSDKLFIESELEVSTGSGTSELGLEYVNMVYFVNNNLALHFGRFLPKFGSYRGKYMESFLNKFSNNPAGFGDGGIGPMVETGFGVQGGFDLRGSSLNYDFYLSNGPQLLTGTIDAPDEAGQFEYEAYKDNNKSKAIGGRIGFLPLSDSSLEIGLSFQHANKTGDDKTIYENVKVDMYAVDVNYFKNIESISSTLKIIGEWKALNAGKVDFEDFNNIGSSYSFVNNSTAYYGQMSIRPVGSSSDILSKIEFSTRYSEFNTPNDALWGGGIKTQTAFSLNYWLGWNKVFKVCYANQKNQPELLSAQLVYGF